MSKIYVIGAGVKGHEEFGRAALELIQQADLLVGGERQLALFPEFAGDKLIIGNNLGTVVARLSSHPGRAVVLASGDPLFFGIGRHLLRNLPEADLSSFPTSVRCSTPLPRSGVPWDDAVFVSTHGRGFREAVTALSPMTRRQCLPTTAQSGGDCPRTDRAWPPTAMRMAVREPRSAEERIVRTDLRGLLEIQAAPLNVLILIKEYEAGGEGVRPVLGIADEELPPSRN